MIIENIRYDILSRGENSSEKLPEIGEIFSLYIQPSISDTGNNSIDTAEITTENVEQLGPYSHIIGQGKINEKDLLPCDAKYAINGKFPLGSKIGQLILKKITNEK